ncbi:MAG TPA: imidazoleglycerol-phosphate dehydratase HisB [Planctomycetota bacterium]|nr:imidazoleglycerol-phosphate dehydratase HisB [Planctomycetota bacterium]HRR79353.1 imidazoleglycerol-phosphate dehydratase HisB [Planctomycetota bacterium]HRT96806.1 imidazoleglycerol-phosphate dehydratase HisB [Planctomycetota bacterium]
MTNVPNRSATESRKTRETDVAVALNLDGEGRTRIASGIGFLDHMLDLLGKHAGLDLEIKATGDTHVDAHHTVEDVGICLGKALAAALGDKRGIRRFGFASVPMDEALAEVSLDLSGRPFLVFAAAFPTEKTGAFDAQLVEEFLRALGGNAGLTLHVRVPYGRDTHHMAEAIFKALARALREAVARDPRVSDVPSTKGVL